MLSNKCIINNNNSNVKANFACLGSLDLTFILHLQKEDIINYNISWNDLNSFKDLIFLKNNINLWKQIELSSTKDTIKLIIQMNKITPNKLKIKYICFSSIKLESQSTDLIDFISYVTIENGLYLSYCEICPCEAKIKLNIYYQNKEKTFTLLDKSPSNLKESKNDNSNKEKNNPFSYINLKALENINYIYFDFTDYSTGEFKDFISIYYLYVFCAYLKIKLNVKIILNLKDEINTKDQLKDLLSVADISIFYNKNKLYEILKNLKYNEDKMSQKKEIEKYLNTNNNERNNEFENKRKEKACIKKLKILNNLSPNKNQEFNDIKSIESKKSTTRTTLSQISNNNKLKIKIIKPMPPKYLEKENMFNYYKEGILEKGLISKNNTKIVLVFEEFNKIYCIKFEKYKNEPSISDFDLKIYPKINVHNFSVINKFKEFIHFRINEYTILFLGCLLNIIASKGEEGNEENNLFLGYLIGVNYIKKISEIEKNNLPLPNDKNFYYFHINKKEVENLIEKGNKRKKENSFVLDCNNKIKSKKKLYNPLLDSCLSQFFTSNTNKELLKTNGFINGDGKLLYDPLYKDSLGFSPKIHRNKKFWDYRENINNDRGSYNSCENSPNKNIIKVEINKYISGHNKKFPNYSIYKEKNDSKQLFPLIKISHLNIIHRNNNNHYNYKTNKGFLKFSKNIFNKLNINSFYSQSSEK